MNKKIVLTAVFTLQSAALAYAAEIKYTSGMLRDPFGDPQKVERKPTDDSVFVEKRIRAMVVQGLLISSKMPRVIIDGRIYNVGSPVDKGKIVSIDKNGVVIEYNGKEILLQPTKRISQ